MINVKDIKKGALESDLAWELVESLTTEVGPRMPGTPGDKAGVAWAVAKFNAMGFDKVWTEPASFPKWIRYSESAAVISPSPQKLHITALGNSISTPKSGIQAQVIEFETLAELENAPKDAAKGKIVFINYKMIFCLTICFIIKLAHFARVKESAISSNYHLNLRIV